MDANRYYLTRDGFENLRRDYERLKNVERPVILDRVKRARELGNFEDNEVYELAREAQHILDGRLFEIESILGNSSIIDEISSDTSHLHGTVSLGTTVTVEVQGASHTFTLVGSIEADPMKGKLSHESPVGSQLLGLKEGDSVHVELPHGAFDYKILKIHE